VPTAALEALVQEVADAALVTLTVGWARVVAQETARRESAAAHNEQQQDVDRCDLSQLPQNAFIIGKSITEIH
jgi:hypothetical protein